MTTGGSGISSDGTGTGTGSGTGSGTGAGVSAAGTGSAFGGSITGAALLGRCRSAGFFDCRVSGNWVVVFSGTLDSGVFENTDALSAGVDIVGGRIVMARLAGAGAAGLIGRTY